MDRRRERMMSASAARAIWLFECPAFDRLAITLNGWLLLVRNEVRLRLDSNLSVFKLSRRTRYKLRHHGAIHESYPGI